MKRFLDSLAIGWIVFVVVFIVGVGGFLLGQYFRSNPWPFIALTLTGITMIAGARVNKIIGNP